jgi:CCR4-NOT transcriptional regulation complex NOT5 subunit
VVLAGLPTVAAKANSLSIAAAAQAGQALVQAIADAPIVKGPQFPGTVAVSNEAVYSVAITNVSLDTTAVSNSAVDAVTVSNNESGSASVSNSPVGSVSVGNLA